jgi:hypothetical protein
MEAAMTPQRYVPTRYVQFEDKEEATKAVVQSASTYNGQVVESIAGKYMAAVMGENLLLVARWGENSLPA